MEYFKLYITGLVYSHIEMLKNSLFQFIKGWYNMVVRTLDLGAGSDGENFPFCHSSSVPFECHPISIRSFLYICKTAYIPQGLLSKLECHHLVVSILQAILHMYSWVPIIN